MIKTTHHVDITEINGEEPTYTARGVKDMLMFQLQLSNSPEYLYVTVQDNEYRVNFSDFCEVVEKLKKDEKELTSRI